MTTRTIPCPSCGGKGHGPQIGVDVEIKRGRVVNSKPAYAPCSNSNCHGGVVMVEDDDRTPGSGEFDNLTKK